jgi:hypothetical protein
MDDSLWVQVPDFPNYLIHPDGHIRHVLTEKYMKHNSADHRVQLIAGNRRRTVKLHRLMAQTFKVEGEGRTVGYRDRDTRNIAASNLYWMHRPYGERREEEETDETRLFNKFKGLGGII